MIRCFTSESVTCGHPDKVCDRIADAVLDAILARDPCAHVACEVTAATDQVHILGEISSVFTPDYEAIARRVIRDIGYTKPGLGFDAETCAVRVDVHGQSPDIAQGINRRSREDSGAGDQGMMIGYACRQTPEYMPLPIVLAHRLARGLESARTGAKLPCLLPDGKTQVTVEYEDGVPRRVSSVIVSAQHQQDADVEELRRGILEKVILPSLPPGLVDGNMVVFINPTGKFTVGGPAGDTGLTGRKVIVDTYGGYARHGGGSFSGKDATKVDRSGAYMARYIAKNIVAAGMADTCEVQLCYAIGLAEPVSVAVDTAGSGAVEDEELVQWITGHIDLRPEMIIRRLGLRAPIYESLSCYGHFGDNAGRMAWERTDMAGLLAADLPGPGARMEGSQGGHAMA